MTGKFNFDLFGAVALTAVLVVSTTSLHAQSIEEKTQVCAGCHGVDGKPADKTIPVIWGQQAGYIYIELRDFKRGDRKSDIMQPIASSMERDDMQAIAEYFSKKSWPDLGQPRASKEISDRASNANRSIGCTGCHLDQFQGDGTIPRLAGQSKEYLTKTMGDFRTRARGNNPGMSDLMIATAPDDLAALSEYLSGL
ncbi:c-type cytochrome [Bradyrhizobium canariense]|uniref:Cytochrome c553 n=1 Tax=Bradyrhizobium canariense TaxID=255045 RepID=A0A1H1UKA3_9BRAD|nr:c-type cytochrome [Bradyrhizobium canariense]SDS72905.1 Cytochrome c553 [Bradyrhizobium canariense]